MKKYLVFITLLLAILLVRCQPSKEYKNDRPVEVKEGDSVKIKPFDEYPGASDTINE